MTDPTVTEDPHGRDARSAPAYRMWGPHVTRGGVLADPHLAWVAAEPVQPRTPQGCEDCLQIGSPWVHLRLCLTCGHVGCCDSSPLRHARGHAGVVGHPIVRSFEPGEDWRWCFVDERFV